MEPSIAQPVAKILPEVGHPLTVAELQTQIEKIRPNPSRNPHATIRSAANNNPLIATSGGRPARYSWWPYHLTDCVFRQPLGRSNLTAGSLVLTDELWLVLWLDFYGDASRSSGEITLVLANTSRCKLV
jgi:hypothetical protein